MLVLFSLRWLSMIQSPNQTRTVFKEEHSLKRNMHLSLLSVVALAALSLGVSPLKGAAADKAVDDYNFAAWLYNTGKHELAIESYESFLKNYPDHEKQADVRFGLAQSHFHLDAFAKAAEQYDAIRADYVDFPQRAEVLFQLGQCRVALEQFKVAEGLFNEVVEEHDDHYLADWAVARRAACLTSLGRNADAEESLLPLVDKYASGKRPSVELPATKEMLEKLEAAGVQASGAFLSLIERSVFTLALAQFNQDHFDDAAVSFKRFQDQYPESTLNTEAGFRRAQSLYRQDDFAAAAGAYGAIPADNAEFGAVAAFERGLSLYKAGKLKPAADVFADMASRFADDARAPKAALYAGTFLYEAGDYAGTVTRLQPLVEEKAKFADEAAYWVAMALFKQDQLAEARDAFKLALSEHPRSALAGDMKLGLADVQLAANELEAAAAAFEDYAQSHRKSEQAPRALYSAAVALHRADAFVRSDEACKAFLGQHAKDALVPDVLFLSGENRFLADDHEGAAARYREFLDRDEASGDRVARAHFRMAWIHHAAKRYRDALDSIKEIKGDEAGELVESESRYLAGICHFELGDHDKAIAELKAYLETPDHSRFGDDALFKTGMAWHRKDDPKKAIQAFSQFLKEYKDSELLLHAQFMLAERYSEIENYGQALKHYRVIAARDDAGELAPYALFGLGVAGYDQKQWAEAADAFAALAERFPESDLIPQARYRRGRALMNLSRWQDAAATFGELLTAAPKHELARSAQVNAAACYQELEQWEDAAKAHDAAIRNFDAGDDQPRLYYELAWSHREAGRMDDALKAFRELANKFPKDPLAADAFFHLAEDTYRKQGELDPNDKKRPQELEAARKLYEGVLDVSEDNRLADKALYRIGWCWWQVDNYDEAAKAFDRLIEDHPKSDLLPDALFQAGLSHANGDNKELARERMEQLTAGGAFGGFSYRADALLALSDYRLALADPDAALESLDAYLSKHTDHHDVARAHLLKGKALYGLKRYEDATASLEESTRLTRSSIAAEAQFYIGQCHQIQSDFKRAVVAYLRVQALYAADKEWCAAATFELSKCYEAQGKADEATAALKQVMNQYKGTQWAKLAEARLQ